MDGLNIVVGLLMLVGLIGIVVPLLPGLPLVLVAVLVWASDAQTPAGWVVLGTATALALTGLPQFVGIFGISGGYLAWSGA